VHDPLNNGSLKRCWETAKDLITVMGVMERICDDRRPPSPSYSEPVLRKFDVVTGLSSKTHNDAVTCRATQDNGIP